MPMIDIPPIVIPPIDIPPIAPMMMDAQFALEMAQATLAAMPPMPALMALDAMPPMPALADIGMEYGMDHSAERAMALADRAQAMADRELLRASRPRRGYQLPSEPPEPSAQQDAGDSLYQAARSALNRGNYESAARLFRSLRDRYSRSTYVGDSYYWEAYALYRQGGSMETYRQAVRALDDQKSKYPRAATRGDSDQLKVRVQGELARMGDPDARRAVDSAAHAGGASSPCASRGDDEDDVRVTALNALMQMNSEDAMPVLKQVLAKRDACSAELRRKAVYVLSNKRSDEAEGLLLDAARNDPDRDVRMAAVSSISNLRTEHSAVALDSIIRGSQDPELQQHAIAALASHPSPKAGDLLRGYVSQGVGSEELREYAIMYLASSRRSTQNSEFLRDQYKRATSRRVKERIVNALASAGGADNAQFLLTLAMDEQEQPETRRMALYQAAQSRMISFDSLTTMYDRAQSREMKETLLNIYAQRRGGEGVDKLIDIVKKEKDRELRNRAVQYLGQSRDPKAAQFLAQLINQ
jgi:HEAT repeat protein